MTKYISDFKNKHLGEDIWIICAGSSMNYIDTSFFDNKITLGVNKVGKKYRCKYAILKDLVKNGAKEIAECESPPFNSDYVFASEWDKGGLVPYLNTDPSLNKLYEKYPDKFYFYKHIKNGFKDESAFDMEDHFFISTSTISTAVHVSAYMGAKNIMICGHDLLSIDNKMYFDEYGKPPTKGMQDFFINRDIHADTKLVRERVKEIYGCNVHTLNPFIGYDMEGLAFNRFDGNKNNEKN